MADGNILTFPARPKLALVTPPSEDAVWFSGGSLHIRYGAHVRHLEPKTAMERREFWRAAAVEAFEAGDMEASRFASRRWADFTKALDDLADYERVMGRTLPLAYSDPPPAANEPDFTPPSAA